MEKLKIVLIANRGEIAVRLIRTAKKFGIKTIAIYTNADAASNHVGDADEAVLLEGPDSRAYTDSEQIVKIAKEHNVDAVLPGYGFLSENTDFAKQIADANMVFAGPSPRAITDFGIKHTARELAEKAHVPIVPGTKGLVESQDEAVTEAQRLGYPVMLKATAGGGGMGLLTCNNDEEVRKSFRTVQSRGETLFKNAGLFIEKYYPESHHIEVQIFGNGQGKAIHFGERECSIQRRHQKVIEEAPSPFILKHPELREKICAAAVRLAESVNYGSAGTIEFLVNDEDASFFFLEMNTRLQVEHPITELIYQVDLVELMLRQADAELSGRGGLPAEELEKLQPSAPKGHAIEARVYAENPARDYAPSPGLLQEVKWHEVPGLRIDTWIHRGIRVSANYDPLLAKVIVYSESRDDAIKQMIDVLSKSQISGPPTNLDFLARVLENSIFKSGTTLTAFLSRFKYRPSAIDVVSGGAYTLVQDWPGRPTVGRGFGHSGPMDPLSFRIANLLVGNAEGVAGFEITLSGPELKFLGAANVAICGAPMECKLDGKDFKMWSRQQIEAGQTLKLGKTTGGGCRSYLAVYGGLPSIAEWFGSKATAPMTTVGGLQGRALAAGDLLEIVSDLPSISSELKIPEHLIPQFPEEWDLLAMPGPHDEGYLAQDFIGEFYKTTFKVSHNAARGGIRLLGPRPRWARSDGGEGGSHPSNVIEYGYPVGTLNWTGDDPCLFPVDAPDFGGFASSVTVCKADWWRLGQMKAGNKLRFNRISYDDAITKRKEVEKFLEQISTSCQSGEFNDVASLNYDALPTSASNQGWEKAVIHTISEKDNQPLVSYRQGGDDFLLIDYGHGSFDLNHRCRAVTLYKKLREANGEISFANGSLHVGMPCGNSLTLHFDSLKIPRPELLKYLIKLESEIGDLGEAKFPGRKFKLPITFKSKEQDASIQRYVETQRPYASYLPDPMEFVAKNNAFSVQQIKNIYTKSTLMVVAVGFFIALPIALPIDPRQRIQSPKMNPSRVYTPESQVGWGGSCMALYNVSSPGGYMSHGLSVPAADILGFKQGYNPERPWLFDDFDQITFYEVSEEEHTKLLQTFRSGRYEYEYEEVEFDMKEHNKLLRETAEEVKEIKRRQQEAQTEMATIENEMLDRWSKEKEAGKISVDTVEELLSHPDIIAVEAPVNANVWKVQVEEGKQVEADQTYVILEAMKLEINVDAEPQHARAIIEKILVKPNDVVDAGKPLLLLRIKK